MPGAYQPLFTDAFLVSVFGTEMRAFRESGEDAALLERLRHWAAKDFQKETAAEADFIDVFFRRTWDYWGTGTRSKSEGYTLNSKLAVDRAGQRGGTGVVDLALGWFGLEHVAPTPQVMCEFKDVRSGLDTAQRRKGNDRSPVQQCADYLKEASQKLYGNEPIQPTWALVSDMVEIRLYWRRTMPSAYQRFFVVAPKKWEKGERVTGLIEDTEDAARQRFFFSKLLHREMLLSKGGPSPLEKLLVDQGVHERAIENDFYREYQAYREEVFRALVDANPGWRGTRGKLVRLTQRFLDRCIFILFCEDMGAALNFPPNILRDRLKRASVDPYYDPNDTSVWHEIKRLFVSMRDGTPFGEARINRFNGGLFAEEPELENLAIPNRVFCTRGQGADEGSIAAAPRTLLFFSSTYYFGTHGNERERGIGLYTLGRIFEQSITDLEFMEAKADHRPSLTELSKRKRDGVYYTPEWVTYFIVDETVGAHLLDLRRRLEIADGSSFTEDELDRYRLATSGKARKGGRTKPPETVVSYIGRLERYASELEQLKVVDPACGSGAFLIQALDRLVRERRWVAEERERITGTRGLFDIDVVTKAVLTQNLYGVDINPESVEITRLALWLHSALPDRPLCTLDENIRCGNSLVGPDFYAGSQQGLFSEDKRERINAFDWRATFSEVFSRAEGRSGFDCVIGNPPYVKLQNFRHVDPDVAGYLVEARRPDGTPLYASTQTGNFDIYLPFLERGMELLNDGGRMGYIAPNVWLVNEYGVGLRRKVAETRRLERWIDFKDYQVFDEAITYTALQFFRGRPGPAIACIFAPDGKVAGTEWGNADALVPYVELEPSEPWIMAPEAERRLMRRLARECSRLGDIGHIIVGIQTSADEVYHMRRIGPGRFVTRSSASGEECEVYLEDGIMRRLVSGEDAKRYRAPDVETYLLLPYDDAKPGAPLRTALEMAKEFPLAWAYLRANELRLRGRERGKMDVDDRWWGYNYPKNLDKQRWAKLGVAQTVPGMRVFFDSEGAFCLNNVRVNGILAPDVEMGWYILGVLNGPVADFVFRRIAKRKEGGYFEANKQFIAPLPVPKADAAQRSEVATRARELQRLHTERRDAILELNRRLESAQTEPAERSPDWIWAEVGDLAAWRKKAPAGLPRERTAWAKARRQEALDAHLARVQLRLRPGMALEVEQRPGELTIIADGAAILDSVFVEPEEEAFIAAQWRQKLRQNAVTPSFRAKRLIDLLLDLRQSANQALCKQVVALDARILALDGEIAMAESQMNQRLYALYALTDEETALVEADARRSGAPRGA